MLTYLPLASGPNTGHIFYFVSIGWAIWFTYALLDVFTLGKTVAQRHIVKTPEGNLKLSWQP
jgi:hypothetical protein